MGALKGRQTIVTLSVRVVRLRILGGFRMSRVIRCLGGLMVRGGMSRLARFAALNAFIPVPSTLALWRRRVRGRGMVRYATRLLGVPVPIGRWAALIWGR